MNIKMVLILLPLTWTILVYVIGGTFNVMGLTVTIVASFILSAITIISLSSIKVLDSGLSDGTNRILFILIFGALFYGGTIAQTYLSGAPQIQMDGLDGNIINVNLHNGNAILFVQNKTVGSVSMQDWGNVNFDNIPNYIYGIYAENFQFVPLGQYIYWNTNINYTNDTNPNLSTSLGFGEGASKINNVDFQNMPYYSMINLIFALMYMLGLYFLVAT